MASTYFLVLIALCSVIYFNDEVKADCGGVIAESNGTITSPLYPSNYTSNQQCLWEIQMPSNSRIGIYFKEFHLENCKSCGCDYVRVASKMEDGQLQEHGKFCGSQEIPPLVSLSNILLIEFKSDSIQEFRGFKMEFFNEGCGGQISGGKGNISTPFFPSSYPPNKVCEWTFLLPPQHKLKLHFTHFRLEGGDGCLNDFLLIQSNSTDGEIREYGKYCGFLTLPIITSKDTLLLKFVSDRSIQAQGFKVDYFIDKFTEFESSTLTRSRTTAYEVITSTVVNQNEDISRESAMSSNNENAFTDEYQSTIPSVLTSSTSTHSTTDSQKIETDHLMRNETNIWSVLKVLTGKISSIEERQLVFFNNFEKYTNVSRSVKSKNGSLED